jgi:hypothetical protein
MRLKGVDLHKQDRRAPSEDSALALPKPRCGPMDEEPAKSLLDGLKEFGFRAFRRARLIVGQGRPREMLRRYPASRDRSREELRDDERNE